MRIKYICALLFFLSLSSCVKDSEEILFQQESSTGKINVIEYDGKVSCKCDINGDGKSEIIIADYSQTINDKQIPINMTISDYKNAVIWKDFSIALASAGWKEYYICEIDSVVYLIRFYPPHERQGSYSYTCEIFNIDGNGNEIVYYKKTGYSQDVEEVSKYLDDAYLLISTWNGDINTHEKLLRGGYQ